MLVLVELRAAAARAGASERPAAATEEERMAVELASPEAAARPATGFAALTGLILLSAFALFYMQGGLKENAAEAIYVQPHQLNFFGCATSLVLVFCKRMTSMDGPALDSGLSVSTTASAPGCARHPGLRGWRRLGSSPMPGSLDGWDFCMWLLLLLVVARGVMCTVVLKKLDCVTTYLVDVSSIIVCTALPLFIDGMAVDRVTLGLLLVIRLCIMQYFTAKVKGYVCADDQRGALRDAWFF